MIHVDEEAETIDWDVIADVVAITFHTPSAYHAYRIAAHFRSRKLFVAMGGPHVTLLPAEASRHADVIFIGEAEGLWEEFLKDFETGTCRRVYQQDGPVSLENAPMARNEFYHRRDHSSGVLFATRGCPSQCDFCTVAVMYRHQLRKRPVAEVAAEYASFKGRVVIFGMTTLPVIERTRKTCFVRLRPIASGGAARQVFTLDAMTNSWRQRLAVAANSYSWV